MFAEADYRERTTAYMWITNKVLEIANRICNEERAKLENAVQAFSVGKNGEQGGIRKTMEDEVKENLIKIRDDLEPISFTYDKDGNYFKTLKEII